VSAPNPSEAGKGSFEVSIKRVEVDHDEQMLHQRELVPERGPFSSVLHIIAVSWL